MMRRIDSFLAPVLVVLAMLLTAGCETLNPPAGGGSSPNKGTVFSIDKIYVGDQIRIVYSDAPMQIPSTEVQVPETGMVTIHLGEQVKVADKKADEVAAEIKKLYTETKQIYRRLAVTVQVLGRYVSVGGDVRSPGNFGFDGGITVLKAINKAGGFTEFGNKKEVRVTRVSGEQFVVNCEAAQKKPELDLPLFPGDRIFVERKIF